MSVEITFGDSYAKKMDPSIYVNAIQDTVSEVAQETMTECQSECPVRTGNLRDSHAVENDEFGRLTALYFLDTTGKATTNEDEVSIVRAEYNRQGRIAKLSYYDKDNKPTIGSAFYASSTWDYDEFGNEKIRLFYDADGNLTNNESGVAKIEYSYDSKTNFMILTKDYNDKGSLISARYIDYDKRGNIIKEYTVDSSGQLKKGSAVVHIDYDTNNRPVMTWWSNLNDRPVFDSVLFLYS